MSKSYFNTDKIWLHGYFPSYVRIAAELGSSARVLELGVLGGESLRMWQSLFPVGQVTGVDISPAAEYPPGTKRVTAGQDDPRLAELGFFDLIVDDASHDGKLTKASFGLLWPQVAAGGFYVIEDWFTGIERYADGAYDPLMLETVQGLLRLLTKNSDVESVNCSYGLAVVRKKAHRRGECE